jgi:hypothetical protein
MLTLASCQTLQLITRSDSQGRWWCVTHHLGACVSVSNLGKPDNLPAAVLLQYQLVCAGIPPWAEQNMLIAMVTEDHCQTSCNLADSE